MPLRKKLLPASILAFAVCAVLLLACGNSSNAQADEMIIDLPEPRLEGDISLEALLAARRSMRSYDDRALTLDEISQVLWAGQGITSDRGGRTAPSAGALYPIKLYLVVGSVEGVPSGVYLYDPADHSIEKVRDGDFRQELTSACLEQGSIADAPASLVITAIPSITEARYADRSMRYIDAEVGCICQSVYLQCETLGLGTVAVGAFHDDNVAEVLTTDAEPRLVMPFGAKP